MCKKKEGNIKMNTTISQCEMCHEYYLKEDVAKNLKGWRDMSAAEKEALADAKLYYDEAKKFDYFQSKSPFDDVASEFSARARNIETQHARITSELEALAAKPTLAPDDIARARSLADEAESLVDEMNKLVALAKRRGFIFPSSQIYGGVSGCWDYGPVGVELKNNIKVEVG